MNRLFAFLILSFSGFLAAKGQNIAVNTTGNAAAAANLFEVTQPAGAPSDYVGIFARNLSTGTNAYAIWAEATGAATGKYAIVVPSGGGNVGIGTITPSTLLTVNNSLIANSYFSTWSATAENINSSSTSTTATEATSVIINTPLPTASSTAFNVAQITNARVPGGALNYGTLQASYNVASFNGTGTLTTAYGNMGRAFNESTGTITTAVGAWNTANNLSTGALGTAYGTLSRVNNGAGTTTLAYGLYADVLSGGTVATGHGVYIGTVAATTKYSLFASDATAPSHFAGSVGIGTTNPLSKVHIYNGASGNTMTSTYSQLDIENSGDAGIMISNPDANIGRVMFGSPARQYGALIRWDNTNNNFDFSTDKAGGYIRFLTDNFSERVRITSAGNMGVGVTNPAYNLEVNGTFGYGNGTAGSYRSRTESRADAGQIATQSGFYETAAPAPAANWPVGAGSWWHLIDSRHSNNGNNYAMQFAGSFFDQNLYFRKTNNNPAQAWSQILTSSNGWMLTGNAGTTAGTNFIGTTDAVDWVVKTTNAERMRVLAAGNVGIGTTTPATLLNIAGVHGTTQARLTLPAAANGLGTGEVNLQLWVSEPGVTWDAAGIGTNVTNNGGAPAGFGRINAALGQSYIRFVTNGGAMAFNTADNAGTYYQTMYMTGGNVGIGTTAPANADGWARVLDVNGGGAHAKSIVTTTNIETGVYSHESGFFGAPVGGILATRSNHPLSFVTNASVKATILTNGNMGIGTITPAQKLDVRGNITQPNDGSLMIFPEASTNLSYHGLMDNNGFFADGIPWYGGFGREPGAWAYPYPDVVINNHTGLRLAAHTNYGGISFYEELNPAGTVWSSTGNELARFRDDRWGGSYFLTKLGIGTSSPSTNLHVQGSVRIADGTQGAGKILVSDASGNASWSTIANAMQVFNVQATRTDINSTSYIDIGGLSQTITTTGNCHFIINTTGSLETKAPAGDNASACMVHLSYNGTTITEQGIDILTNSNYPQVVHHWGINQYVSLPAGTYTFKVQARSYLGIFGTLYGFYAGGALTTSLPNDGSMTIQVIPY